VTPAFLFDLDGTLVDSVYQHVLAWREALESNGIELAVWRIHRRIGMSGGLFVNALLREIGREVTREQVARIQLMHAQAFLRQASQVRPLPGARDLLAYLSAEGVAWATEDDVVLSPLTVLLRTDACRWSVRRSKKAIQGSGGRSACS
jgi:beta-phosphoglucomutase-like phosphatase (HAD superfamily)